MITGVAFRIMGSDFFIALPAPNRHHHVIRFMTETGCYTRGEIAKCTQGFVTDKNIFLDRKQAAAHALSTNQIEELSWPPNLFSEDLW